MKKQEELLRHGDWKELIVLDGCRFEEFEKVCDLEGTLEKVDSEATDTVEWYSTHFRDSDWPNTLLLSSTPQPFKESNRAYCRENFHESYLLFGREDSRRINPYRSLEKARGIMKDHPGYRTIIHLVPPHVPWLGKKGEELGREIYGGEDGNKQKMITKWARENDRWDDVRECHRENISIALDAVKRHLDTMDALVITSDHSNLLGEDDTYGHLSEHPKLREVPWLKVGC